VSAVAAELTAITAEKIVEESSTVYRAIRDFPLNALKSRR